MIPDERTLTPEQARRALAESRRARRRTDSIVERAAAALATSRDLGERNGFTEGVKALLRGTP